MMDVPFPQALVLTPPKTNMAGWKITMFNSTSSFTVVFPLSNVSKLGGEEKFPEKTNLFRYPAMLIQLETFETSNSCRVQELDVPGTRVDFLTRCLVSAPWCAVRFLGSDFRKGPYLKVDLLHVNVLGIF